MESESDLRGVIRDWLVRNGITPREEYQMGVGRADLYLGGYRVIIEVKTRQSLRNGPHTPRPSPRGENETPFEQVSRYVEADRNREQTRLDEDRNSGWLGCVTDSERWWVWTYPADGGEPQRFLNFDGIIPAAGEMDALLERFRRGTQWAPPSPFFLFKQALRDLEGLYRQRRGPGRPVGILLLIRISMGQCRREIAPVLSETLVKSLPAYRGSCGLSSSAPAATRPTRRPPTACSSVTRC